MHRRRPATSAFTAPVSSTSALVAVFAVAAFLPFLSSSAVAESAAAPALPGRVLFTGDSIPVGSPINFGPDPHCHGIHENETVLTEEYVVDPASRGVANVFVSIVAGLPPELASSVVDPSLPPARIDQRGCTYVPHVVAMRAGQSLEIVSSDRTLHNINVQSKTNRPFNMAMPEPMSRKRPFREAESPIRVKCDAHPWMEAWLHVVPHPFFAVTDATGAFSLPVPPDGTYTLRAWHERMGVIDLEAKVEGGRFACEPRFEFDASRVPSPGAPAPPAP